MNAIAYLIIVVNSANWSSTDVRTNAFPSMAECRAALESMKIATAASQAGDKSGMIAAAYCSPSPNTVRFFDTSGKEIWR